MLLLPLFQGYFHFLFIVLVEKEIDLELLRNSRPPTLEEVQEKFTDLWNWVRDKNSDGRILMRTPYSI